MEEVSALALSRGTCFYALHGIGCLFFGVFCGERILHIESFCIASSIWQFKEDATPCCSWSELCRVMIAMNFVLEHERLLTAMAGSPPKR